jgi:hypothetical protein
LATGAVNRLQKETRESDFIDWGNNNVAIYKSAIDEPCNAENMRGLFEETTCDSIQVFFIFISDFYPPKYGIRTGI